MNPREVKLRALREASEDQWALITTGQCHRLGINRQDIAQFHHRGALTTVLRGVYLARDEARNIQPHDDPVIMARAGWLALGPTQWAHDRRRQPRPDAVVAHSTALTVLGIAAPQQTRPELLMAKSARKSHNGVLVIESAHQLDWRHNTLVNGLPVQRIPSAIAGLINSRQHSPDLEYVAAAMRTCLSAGIEHDALLDTIANAAARHSVRHIDIRKLLVESAVQAGLDRDQASRALLSDRWNQRLSAQQLQVAVRAILDQIADACTGAISATEVLHHLGSVTDLTNPGRLVRCSVPDCTNQPWQTGLCPVHTRARKRTIATTASPSATRSGHGLRGVLDDDGETIACHECGARLRQLTASHLATHDLTTEDYKHIHGINRSVGLIASNTHATYADRANRTGATERIREAQGLSPRSSPQRKVRGSPPCDL
jgi:predicted transcriptional regulator